MTEIQGKSIWFELARVRVIGSQLYNKYATEISEESLEQKSVTKGRSKFSCDIVVEFQ